VYIADGKQNFSDLYIGFNIIRVFYYFFFVYLQFSLTPQNTKQKPKMGAEKVTMNIVVVGQVQSAKAIKLVAKATPATSQLLVS